MIPCIACNRHVVEDDDEDDADKGIAAASITKAEATAAKSFTSQLKDVVLKISSGYKQCRPCASFRTSNHSVGDEIFTVGTSDASSSDEWVQQHGNSKASKGLSKQSSASSLSEAAKIGLDDVSTSTGKVSPSSSSARISNGTACTTPKVEGEDDTGLEWVAQVEPGVLITFISLPHGENELKRIRFSRELFNKWQAEAWWSDNCERVHELYNVSGSDRSFPNSRKEHQTAALAEQDASSLPDQKLQADANLNEDSVTEWVEEDEPGVYITVKVGAHGRELKRVRFSREKFSEKQAKLWWERNRFRVHDQYL